MDVAAGGFVERRGNDLAAHRALHVGDLFRPLVDEQHDEDRLGIIVGDRTSDVLHQDGLAGAGRRTISARARQAAR